MSVQAILAELQALRLEVQALRLDVARLQGRAGRRAADDDVVVLAIAAAIPPDHDFTSAEIVEHARTADVALCGRLSAAGLLNARALGRLFRRVEGRAVAARVVVRCIGETSAGLCWRVWDLPSDVGFRASNALKPTLASSARARSAGHSTA